MKLSQFSLVNQVDTEPEHTVVLVGAALDGPSHSPFTLNENTNVYEALGQSPLADAYHSARKLGMRNIVAYRLNGAHSEALLIDKLSYPVLKFRSICASDIYNETQLIVHPTHLYVVGVNGVARSYFFDKYKKAYELAYAMNRDAHYGLLDFNVEMLDEQYVLLNMVDTVTEVMFKGGESEEEFINSRDPLSASPKDAATVVSLLKERLELSLFGEDPLDALERQPMSHLGALHCGVIALCDMYHDDDPELTEMLGSFCMNKTKEVGFGCIGVIGTKPIYSPFADEGDVVDMDEVIHARVLELVSLSESLEDKEAYKYVQVVVGQTVYTESEESSISLAPAYAATQAQLPVETMMSNKAITGVGKLNSYLNKEDVALLTANGYICTVPSIRRGFVPFYATSYSKDKESLMAKPHLLRISQYVSRMLVEELDSLVGSNYATLSIKEAVKKAEEVLDELVAGKVIRSYELRYELLDRNTALNVEASLTTFSEVRAVNSIAIISFPQGVIK